MLQFSNWDDRPDMGLGLNTSVHMLTCMCWDVFCGHVWRGASEHVVTAYLHPVDLASWGLQKRGEPKTSKLQIKHQPQVS